jgi:hypothetical protein
VIFTHGVRENHTTLISPPQILGERLGVGV